MERDDIAETARGILLEMRAEIEERMRREVIASITEKAGSPIPDNVMAWLSPCIELCAHEAVVWFTEQSIKMHEDK